MPFSLDSLKATKPTIVKKTTTVKTTTAQSTKPAAPKQSLPSRISSAPQHKTKLSAAAKLSRSGARQSYPTPPAEQTQRKRATPTRSVRSSEVPDFGDDSDGSSDEDALRAVKKPRINTPDDMPPREVRAVEEFEEGSDNKPEIIHGEEVRSLDTRVKYQTAFEGLPAQTKVSLQYPSAAEPERFELVKGKKQSDYNALEDIHATMKMVAKHYLPAELREQFDHEGKGYPQRLNRAMNKRNQADLIQVIEEWNEEMVRLRKDGTIAKQLDALKRMPADLVERIMNQAHARTVSPEDHILHAYDAGSNEVYGELLPRFVSRILAEDTKITSKQVFIDLGSGVGNVVLQAALEAGCESWGCEIKTDYCDLAEAQQKEFEARCRLWGLKRGEIHLERGDFIANDRIRDALRRADVVVVNNEVFSAELNDSLKSLFLDLKEGCRIISLKSFVPEGHKISIRNSGDPVNILKVVKKEYFSGFVSWKDRAGTYFISTKDSSILKKFMERNQ